MLVVYIAGPYRAASSWEREQNIRRAEEVAYHVWEAGHVALCPHTNCRWQHEGVIDDAHWLAGTMELMRRCDAVVALPYCAKSAGTRAEILVARQLGMPVFDVFCIDEQGIDCLVAQLDNYRWKGTK